MRFTGKVAVVTGAARGIGAAIARAFAIEGADVVINDVGDGEPLAEEIRGMGRRAFFARADVADESQVEAMMARALAELGRIDIVVPNAAYSERGPFHSIPMDKFRRTLDVTMWGALHCLRSAIPRMIEQGTGGSIVVISSPHAVVPVKDSMPYNMAKAAVDHMAKTAATELLEHRIRVNIIHPGWTDTPGERKFFREEELIEQGRQIPSKRLARPEEIARGALFLADDASEYINGTTLVIDGGIQLPWSQKI